MGERARTIAGWAATAGSIAYWGFVKLDMWVGHLTFWDNVREKVLPFWREEIAPMLTADNLAMLCFAGGIATLVWVHFGERIRGLAGWSAAQRDEETAAGSERRVDAIAQPPPRLLPMPLGVGGLPMGLPDIGNPTALVRAASTEIDSVPDDPQAKHDLIVFYVDFVMPAIKLQSELQHAAAYKLGGATPYMRVIISFGLGRDPTHDGFNNAVDLMQRLINSGPSKIAFAKLLRTAIMIRDGYWSHAGRITLIMPKEHGMFADEELRSLWVDWVAKHNALCERGKVFGRDIRFPGLYNPVGGTHFGPMISPDEYAF